MGGLSLFAGFKERDLKEKDENAFWQAHAVDALFCSPPLVLDVRRQKTMSEIQEEIDLLDAIYNRFPEAAKDLDKTLRERWACDPEERNEMWTGLIERFSQLTTEAISRGDEKTAREYLDFMEKQYFSGGENCKKAIDVYYVESLLWDIKDLKKKQWGWALIPNSLQELYIAMWGKPGFKK